MTERLSRRDFLGVTGAMTAALAGCLGGSGEESVDWRETELEAATSETRFTVAELDGTVLLHPFAIWCGTCNRQNEILHEFNSNGEFEIVQLNIGDGESDSDVATYARERGYDERARFATAPSTMAGSLADEFGAAVVNPPLSPIIVRCPDGSVTEIDKIIRSESLATELDSNCA